MPASVKTWGNCSEKTFRLIISHHATTIPERRREDLEYSCLGGSRKTGLSISHHCHTIITCIYLETKHTRTHVDRGSKKEGDAAAQRKWKRAIKWRHHNDSGATLASYAEQLGWRIPLCNCTLGLYELATRKKRIANKVLEGKNWNLTVARMSAPIHLGDIFWSVECA